ncbi:transcription factor GTE4-like protein [Tanacetum coccineum]
MYSFSSPHHRNPYQRNPLPASADFFELLDYHELIKVPMDFSIVRRKLDGGHYATNITPGNYERLSDL